MPSPNPQLTAALRKIVDMVIYKLDRKIKYEESIEETDTYFTITRNYFGRRHGDAFFTPRPYEEDDDFPDFTARPEILQGLRKYLGKNCIFDAYDHEKGMFTIQILVRKDSK